MRRWGWLLLVVGCGPRTLAEVDPAVFDSTPTYASQVAPLYGRSCVSCHSSDGLRAGGVELDRYDSAYAGQVHQVCTAINAEVRDHFAEFLKPAPRQGEERGPCEGWELESMPTGAVRALSLEEQVILARWLELGAPP
ncbi:MAG: hypothetical protein IPG45_19505 [Deltaproteobacteria bacterium]|nr:hypothetical protein [Deltaproteobacteria bacterium]